MSTIVYLLFIFPLYAFAVFTSEAKIVYRLCMRGYKKIYMTVIILNHKNSRYGLNQKLIAIIEALLNKICQEWNIYWIYLLIRTLQSILQFFSN